MEIVFELLLLFALKGLDNLLSTGKQLLIQRQKPIITALCVVLGIIAFKPAAEPNLVPIKPVNTPEIVDIEIIPTPSPEPPAPTIEVLPEETPIVEEVTENVEGSYTPSKKKDTSAAFFLVINDEKVNIAHRVDESTLKKTPGWLESSAEPGEDGVCVIYGHRNRNHLQHLKALNSVTLLS